MSRAVRQDDAPRRNRKSLNRRYGTALTAGLLGLSVLSCTTPLPGPVWKGSVPAQSRWRPGTEAYAVAALKALREDYYVVAKGRFYEEAWTVLDRLFAGSEIDPTGWEVYVVDAPGIADIRAVPERHLFLWSGLLALVNSEEQLAGLIALELAHALAQHNGPVAFHPATELLFNLADVATTVGLAVASQGIVAVRLPGLVRNTYIDAAGLDPLERSYTEEQERETAFIALNLLSDAGYCPKVLVRFWERIDSDAKLRASARLLIRDVSPQQRVAILQQELLARQQVSGEVPPTARVGGGPTGLP